MALGASLRPQLGVPGRPKRRGPGVSGARLGAGVGTRVGARPAAAALHDSGVDLALLGGWCGGTPRPR